MRKKEIVVIGLGRFGTSVVNELLEHGAIVTALDIDQSRVDYISSKVAFSATVDCTSEEILKSLDIINADHILVSIGSNIEASIMTILALKSIGAQKISVKAADDKIASVYTALGVENVILPEKEAGILTAKKILSSSIKNFVELDEDHSIVQIKITKEVANLTNVPLINISLRKIHEINIIAIKRETTLIIPTGDDVLHKNDEITIIGSNKSISKFENLLTS